MKNLTQLQNIIAAIKNLKKKTISKGSHFMTHNAARTCDSFKIGQCGAKFTEEWKAPFGQIQVDHSAGNKFYLPINLKHPSSVFPDCIYKIKL